MESWNRLADKRLDCVNIFFNFVNPSSFQPPLQRFISIFLFGLLLYNMAGYAVVYLLEEKQRVDVLGEDFSEWYQVTENVVLKIPVNGHGETSDLQQRELLTGLENDLLQVESRQLVNDTLYVHCIFSVNARDQFFNLASQINDQLAQGPADTEKGSHSHILKNFLKEYMLADRKQVFYVLEWTPSLKSPSDFVSIYHRGATVNTATPPPDFV